MEIIHRTDHFVNSKNPDYFTCPKNQEFLLKQKSKIYKNLSDFQTDLKLLNEQFGSETLDFLYKSGKKYAVLICTKQKCPF